MIVTYDTADGCFDFYTDDQWDILIMQWREMLDEDGENVLDADEVEIFERIHGDEVFYDTLAEDASVVTFDLNYQSFDYYADSVWVRQINEWRSCIKGYSDWEDEEVVEETFSGDLAFYRSHDFLQMPRSDLK
jgi:hypothetical protein|tara:strand:- start:1019 stop:1417 length:399 start_codon:yes stop_codon:yes gene_type:complete